MKVEVTSREMVKPSSPTPEHQRYLQLSFIDQQCNRNVMPTLYFYTSGSGSSNIQERCDQLKKSLSETLTKFYPLAGRLKEEDLFVECNDEGVPFAEAKVVQCQLSQVLGQPNTSDLNKLLPSDLRLEDAGELLLSIQLNIFECGGIAIAICISHKIADGLSAITFVNCWSAIASEGEGSGLSDMVCPQFDAAKLFPPRLTDMSCYRNVVTNQDKTVAKRFLFEDTTISAVKAKYAIGLDDGARPLSRVEALTVFLWNRLMEATEEEDVEGKPGSLYIVVQATDLRTRATPPLPVSSFGNLSRFAVVLVPSTDESGIKEHSNFVTQMRKAISNIDGDYVKNLQEGNIVLDSNKDDDNVRKVCFAFSSLFRFPFYEADFGWGKPIWVTVATLPFKNQVMFMPTRSGLGIEVWVLLEVEAMVKLEADKQFLAFVSPGTDANVLPPNAS